MIGRVSARLTTQMAYVPISHKHKHTITTHLPPTPRPHIPIAPGSGRRLAGAI